LLASSGGCSSLPGGSSKTLETRLSRLCRLAANSCCQAVSGRNPENYTQSHEPPSDLEGR